MRSMQRLVTMIALLVDGSVAMSPPRPASPQLFYPIETTDGSCGVFTSCPEHTICMRAYDRQEAFGCFAPHFGSARSFLDHQPPSRLSSPPPPPSPPSTRLSCKPFEISDVLLFAGASFGALCAVALVATAAFALVTRLIRARRRPTAAIRRAADATPAWPPRQRGMSGDNPVYERAASFADPVIVKKGSCTLCESSRPSIASHK